MNHRIPLFTIIALGFVLYGVLLVLLLPPFQVVKYWHAADLLIHGQLKGERILDFSPLYLYFNVLLIKLKATPAILLWMQILCTMVSSVLLFEILKRSFRLSLAFLGAVAFLFDRSLMEFTHAFEPEPFVMVCIIAATYFITRDSWKSALLAGISFGLGILTRPNFVPALFLVPVCYFVNAEDRAWRKKAALFLIPALLCLCGLWIRNAGKVGYFSPFVMNPGTVFYEGNNPNSQGMSSVYPPVLNQLSEEYSGQPDYHHQLYRDFARRITGQSLTLAQVNSYWINHALNFLLENPGHAIRLFGVKLFHVFHSYQWHDLANSVVAENALRQSILPVVPFSLVSSLALLGIFILIRQWRRYFIFYTIFFIQFFLMLTIYVSARQRISILFLFVFFACGALQFIFANPRRWILLVVILPICLILQRKTDLMREEDHLWQNTLLSQTELAEAYRLRVEGKLKEAATQSAKALALAPWFFDSRRPANIHFREGYVLSALAFSSDSDPASQLDRGVLLVENNQPQEAQRLFESLLRAGYHLKRDDQQSSNLHFYIARCEFLLDKKVDALKHLQQGLEDSPGDPWVLSYLFALTNETGFRDRLYRYFDDIDAQFFLGKAYLETKQPANAVPCFRYVVEMLPNFRKANIYLAAALSDAGNNDEAAMIYRKAIRLGPDPVFREEEMLKLFREIAESRNNARSRYSYGIVLRQFGYYTDALKEQQKASLLDVSNRQIQEEILMLKKAIASSRNTN